MKNLPFIQELTEARLFYGVDDIKGKSVEDIASMVYLMIMMLEILRHSNHAYASEYANKTMAFAPYDSMHYSGTDLGNLIAVLNNQDTFKAYVKMKSGISIPVFQINRYLQACKGSSFNHNEDATFFYRLEDYLKLYSKGDFRILRRNVGDWASLSHAERTRVMLLLRQEFDRRCSTADIYLWFKSNFKLKESVTESVDLKLDYHTKLNPALWDGFELKEDVKEALGKIANKFSEFIDVKQMRILDYIITGSNCAFNYTPDSDIDIHVVVDASALGDNPLTSPFLLAKKSLWNSGHDITVKGFDVELYAEDANDKDNKLVATGVYSLLTDEWIKRPEYEPIQIDDQAVRSKAEDIMQQIDQLIADGNVDQEAIDKLWDHIRKMRRSGLSKGGEFSVENLAFKVVRNNGYFDKLRDFERNLEDEELSLESIAL